MIKIESVYIEWMRGVARLDFDLQKKTFAISGPNGSGKSAVIDAIEFALTGRIGRLTGRGTKVLSMTEHGPHVDKRDSPAAAFVKVQVFIPELGKSATITRKFNSPAKPSIKPEDNDVKTVLARVEDHPEIALSRRDIVRFILVEPGKRSEEIQALLKLNKIGENRKILLTTKNKLQTNQKTASTQKKNAAETLCRHLQIDELTQVEFLTAVNKRRTLLDIPEILTLSLDTDIAAELSESTRSQKFNKQSALTDLRALSTLVKELPNLCAVESEQLLADITNLESDPTLLTALQRQAFIEKGLNLVEGPECPLCDTVWPDEQHLRAHLQEKLSKAEEAQSLQESLRKNGGAIAETLTRVIEVIRPICELAHAEDERAYLQLLTDWKTDLEKLEPKLVTGEGVIELKEHLKTGWVNAPPSLSEGLQALTERIKAKPDQTASTDAQTFLTVGQFRLSDYWKTVRENDLANAAADRGKAAYEAYRAVSEEALNKLYNDVQGDFSNLYRELNGDDEKDFKARFTPKESELDLDVDFYGRGLFPPGAYHSEGHQDGMGVCLYLALMKHLFGDHFSLALLDDVMMSVDSGHRVEFCRLLKNHFPKTQFIITTHDRLWAEQMKSAGLVTAKTSATFHSWTIDAGPLLESGTEIWDKINQALVKDEVETAAFFLRRHLEYVSTNLADKLGASLKFRADGSYELGDLLPGILSRMDKLLINAETTAQSWGNQSLKDDVRARRLALSNSKAAMEVQRWTVNKAVHYNEWANFRRNDFEPVVKAFRDLLDKLHCDVCKAWLYVIPKRGTAEVLRCDCATISLNLKRN